MRLDVAQLSSILFWDVSQDDVSWNDHSTWIIERVLSRGTWEDWQLVKARISTEEIASLEPELRLEPRERNFLRNWIRQSHED